MNAKHKRLHGLCTLLALAAVAASACVQAQDAEKPAEPEKKPVLPSITLTLGTGTWHVNRNENRFRQYASPPRGLFIESLTYAPLNLGPSRTALFNLKGLGATDWILDGAVALNYGATRLEGFVQRNEYYSAPLAFIDSAHRLVQSGTIRQLLSGDLHLSLGYSMDERVQPWASPRWIDNQRIRYWDVAANAPLLAGRFSLTYSDLMFWDRTTILPDTNVRRWQAGQYVPVGATGILEGSFSRTEIRQADQAAGRIDVASANGSVGIGNATDVSVAVRRDQMTDRVSVNGGVREQRMASVIVNQRFAGWNARIGVRQRESERVRRDISYADVPRWWNLDTRLNGKAGRECRISLKSNVEWLRNEPTSVMADADPRSLYWDRRQTFQVKVDAGPAAVNGYLVAGFRRLENTGRMVKVTARNLTAGGTWQVNPRISAFGEWTYDDLKAESEITSMPTLEDQAPSTRTTAVGLSWVIGPSTWASASYTDWITANGNPLHLGDANTAGRGLALNVQHKLRGGQELSLVYSPITYKDYVMLGEAYDATVLRLSARTTF